MIVLILIVFPTIHSSTYDFVGVSSQQTQESFLLTVTYGHNLTKSAVLCSSYLTFTNILWLTFSLLSFPMFDNFLSWPYLPHWLSLPRFFFLSVFAWFNPCVISLVPLIQSHGVNIICRGWTTLPVCQELRGFSSLRTFSAKIGTVLGKPGWLFTLYLYAKNSQNYTSSPDLSDGLYFHFGL